MNNLDEIKSKFSVVDCARQNGLPVNKEGDRTASIIDPGNNKTCTVFYNDWWFDFKTQQGGDVIDLHALLNHNGNIGDAIRDLMNQLGIAGDYKFNNDLENIINNWHKELLKRPELIKHLHDRNISDKTIEDLKIGYSKNRSRIIIPFFKFGHPVSWIGRTVKEETDKNPKYFKSPVSDGYLNVLWGLDTLNRDTPLIITEGAFDALSIYQEGYAILSTMGTFISKQKKLELISISRKFDHVILAFDNDEAGQIATFNYAKYLFNYNVPFKVINIPKSLNDKPIKDINDYYQQTKELSSLVDNSIEDLVYFVMAYKNSKEKFSKFAYKLARIKQEENVDYFIDLAIKLTDFEKGWLNQLRKSIKSPKQKVIRDEIVNTHELVYNSKLNFHEFNNEIWENKVDRDIQQLIDKQLGNLATKNLVNGVLELVKNKCNSNVEFNKKLIMTFKNGVLELDTGKFRGFNKNDYSTIQLNYKYDSDSKCERFEKYLDEITNSDQDKKLLLQEIMGYCLYPENSLHKVFFLIGSGGNGKSVFFKIIEALYGLDNVTHVAVDGLSTEFQRIQLKDSVVNIQPDFTYQPNYFSKPDGYFKSIVAGDTINGCYKGKDFMDFQPRAKWIMGANEMFKSKDSSDGMARRFIFVEFPVKFVDDPKNPNEKKLDPDLKDKLMKELPGIFNWAYQGYKRLKKNGKFTETEEQDRLKEEFLSSNDPVIAFVKDYEVGNKVVIIYKDAFEDYKKWCIENNIGLDMYQQTFSKEFAEQFIKRNPKWQKSDKRIYGQRGLIKVK